MGYLVCKNCGDKYKLKKGESPENYVCHCGGEVEYHLSSYDVIKIQEYIPNEVNAEERAKIKAFDKKIIRIIKVAGFLLIISIPLAIIIILIYRAYYNPIP